MTKTVDELIEKVFLSNRDIVIFQRDLEHATSMFDGKMIKNGLDREIFNNVQYKKQLKEALNDE